MGKYTCEKCGKEFTQKSHHTTHINKKNPCIAESKISELISNAVKEKLIEIKKASPNDLISKIEINYDNKLVKSILTKKIHISKPLLKWVGGKTQIIDTLVANFPVEINNYREVFLGGGSVLLALLSYVKSGIIKLHGNIYAYDLNEPLIYVYKNIQTHHKELYDILQTIISEFNTCGNGTLNRTPETIEEAKSAKENYYYWIRSEYNKLNLTEKKSILGSAMFIFLNKTCFRGVFRVGPNGFNVPYGHYNNPEIINKQHLEEITALMKNVVFECCDFTTSLARVEDNDFVYIDPPYAPETQSSFVGYTEKGFTIENHNNLFKLIHALTSTNKKLMLSNADVSLVRENFCNCDKNEKYNILPILCKRSINSKNPESKAKEVIITNY